jgi:hypothetical protein
MMSKCRAFAVLIFLGLLLMHCGCGRVTNLKRFPVHGTVTMPNGERINGSITFLPEEGQSGPAATATLAEGKYEFDSDNGPTVGPHIVKIRRLVSRSAPVKASEAKQKPLTNAEWILKADIKVESQGLQDFTIDK